MAVRLTAQINPQRTAKPPQIYPDSGLKKLREALGYTGLAGFKRQLHRISRLRNKELTVSDHLPQESKAQEIGHKAELALSAAQPLLWRRHSLEGTDDAGLDFQVQLVGNRKYQNIFRLQLKGTESPLFNESSDFLSITFKSSTLNYYDRIIEPVLIVASDLSRDIDPSKCPSYFVWAHDEIRRLKTEGRFEDETESKTIRIPTANILTRNLDVSRVLEDHMRLHATANEFDQAVAAVKPELQAEQRAEVLGMITSEIPRRGQGFIESISTPGSTPWPQAPKESTAGRLNTADQSLKLGDTSSAERILEELQPKLATAAPLERAEFWYLTGRCLSLNSKEQEAADAHDKAHAAEPNATKYLLASVETKLRLRHKVGQPWEASDLLSQLISDKPEIVGMAARLLAASGQYEQAKVKLATLGSKDAVNDRAIIATMQGNTAETISLCNEGLADKYIQENSRHLLHLLRGRAYFNQALHLEAGCDFEIPPFGPAQIDYEMLNYAWNDIQTTVELMRVAGWPTNIEFLADIWGGAAIILGRHEEVLQDVLDAANKRPTFPCLQNCLERVAALCGRFDLVIKALERQSPSPEIILRKIVALHQARENSACVGLMQAEMGNLPRDHPLFPISLTMALLSADHILREDAARDFEILLRSNPAWESQVLIAEYYRSIDQNILGRNEALVKLEDAYGRFKNSIIIANQLFYAFDTSDPAQAEKCISIAPNLREHSQFSLESTLHLAQAYATLNKWPSLLSLVDASITQFGRIGRLVAVRALALDKCGYTAEAVVELRGLVASGVRDKLAINTYINIVTRCGFTKEATDLVESLIGQETDSTCKLDYLRLLFGLVHRSDPQGQRSESIAWRIGQLVKQEDEAEEGLFLITYLSATLSTKVNVTDDRKAEMQQRLCKFTERYPTSKILRSASLPENPSIQDLERMIVEVTGEKPERRAWQEKMLLQLERGTAPIPFAWRPRNILLNVFDVAQLWEIAKNSKRDARQYHLTMALANWHAVDIKVMERHVPILDLITLFIVKDLELFGTLFALFPHVAISQATLMQLQRLTQPMSGSWAQMQCVELIEKLQENFSHIMQPILPGHLKSDVNEKEILEEVKELAKSGKFMLYSDDALYRIFAEVPNEAPPPICTLDILIAAESRGILTSREIAERISKLVKWNVDTVIGYRYVAAAIPESINKAKSIEGAVGILQSDEIANPILEGIWNVRKSYDQLVTDAGNILAFLVQEPRNRMETIAAIWALWYIKAKLRSDVAISPALRHAALAMLKATALLTATESLVFQLLWQSYLALVPIEYGNRMDEQREREAIELVGGAAAQIELATPEGAEPIPLKDRLLKGLTDGTAYHSWFIKAYSNYRIQHELRKKKP